MNVQPGSMVTRRVFLAAGAVAATGTGAPGGRRAARETQPGDESARTQPEGEITADTVAEAQKLAGLEFDEAERKLIAEGAPEQVESFHRRREMQLDNGLGPATVFRPVSRTPAPAGEDYLRMSPPRGGDLPAAEADIAFASIANLSRWFLTGQISSERLTRIYLDRLKRLGPKLECVVTLTEELALDQARRADKELAAGRYRGPLHGVPWGAKDLFDTAGIRTTWGATPYQSRVAETDAVVVRRLAEAGAVLVAKLTLGALAYGDIWFGGKTRNPWNPEQGSSGSSAGPAAATAAGLVGFGLGTETYGSIVSPCMRCGTTGLRPTFGRVARTGAMALCWSLDKIGPICRTVEDAVLVLHAINGADAGDPSSVDVPVRYEADSPLDGLRVGYSPAWFEGRSAGEAERGALDVLRSAGVTLVEVSLPDWPYDALLHILTVEAAAAFEELTLTNRDDELVWQEPQAWPNTFRQTWFVPAIEYVQAQRVRRRVCEMMADLFADVHALISPSFAANLLLITNHTGHPALTVRVGFGDERLPRGLTLWGRLFDEGTLCRLGLELERRLGVWDRRPDLG